MKKPATDKETVLLCIILLASLYLAFKGLGDNYLWDDEANTAFFGRSLLRFGTLTGWDGRNLMGFRNGASLNSDLITVLEPPMQYVVAALSLKLFGDSTFSARALFAFIGWLSIPLFYLVLSEAGLGNKTKLAALAIYSLSPTLLLYLRQARYYSLVLFLGLCSYYLFNKYLASGKTQTLAALILCGVLLFYSNYLAAAALFASVIVSYAALNRKKVKYGHLKALILFILATAALVCPYVLYTNVVFKYGDIMPPDVSSSPWDRLTLLYWHVREINGFGWMPWVVASALILLLASRDKQAKEYRTAAEWSALSILFVAFLAAFSPQRVAITDIADMRYAIGLMPFLSGLSALSLGHLWKKSRIVSAIFFILLVTTNLLSLTPPNPALASNLLGYLHEINNDYTTPYEAVDRYLEENAKQDDSVFIEPLYMGYPILYYRGGQVEICCLLDNNTLLPKEKIYGLNKELFIEEAAPDWLVMFGRRQNTERLVKYFSRRGESYSLVDTLDVYYADMTRPELPYHSFRPTIGFNPNVEGILIYKRQKP